MKKQVKTKRFDSKTRFVDFSTRDKSMATFDKMLVYGDEFLPVTSIIIDRTINLATCICPNSGFNKNEVVEFKGADQDEFNTQYRVVEANGDTFTFAYNESDIETVTGLDIQVRLPPAGWTKTVMTAARTLYRSSNGIRIYLHFDLTWYAVAPGAAPISRYQVWLYKSDATWASGTYENAGSPNQFLGVNSTTRFWISDKIYTSVCDAWDLVTYGIFDDMFYGISSYSGYPTAGHLYNGTGSVAHFSNKAPLKMIGAQYERDIALTVKDGETKTQFLLIQNNILTYPVEDRTKLIFVSGGKEFVNRELIVIDGIQYEMVKNGSDCLISLGDPE